MKRHSALGLAASALVLILNPAAHAAITYTAPEAGILYITSGVAPASPIDLYLTEGAQITAILDGSPYSCVIHNATCGVSGVFDAGFSQTHEAYVRPLVGSLTQVRIDLSPSQLVFDSSNGSNTPGTVAFADDGAGGVFVNGALRTPTDATAHYRNRVRVGPDPAYGDLFAGLVVSLSTSLDAGGSNFVDVSFHVAMVDEGGSMPSVPEPATAGLISAALAAVVIRSKIS